MTAPSATQRVVIFGGTSGIGLAAAQLAAEDGAQVVVVGRRHVDDALAQLPGSAEGYVVDVRDESSIRELFTTLGAFDHLVYTAGETLTLGAIEDMDLQAARRAFDTRMWGAYGAVKHGHAQIRPGGSIVLSSGSAGARPQATWSIGASICGAIEALTRALAVELAPIRVNAVAPGVVRTDLWRDLSDDERQELYDGVGANLLVGRVGEAREIAEAVVFLMNNHYSSGTVLAVDGGALLI
jgi:NAD(P)-dependent dehydrogenase (short-subunit alcohol dehydrogenase family)